MKTIFLDLDGTLTDPKPGITKSVVYALEKLGLEAPDPDSLTWVIGPALLDSFEKLGAPDPAAALAFYRERFATVGLFENRVYQGIKEALITLAQKHRLCLATAKPHVYATRITAHFGLNRHLFAEFSPELDGTRNDKAELLAHALERLGIEPETCVMVGDRHHDIDAARTVGMASIGVTWGYGAPGELDHATRLCGSPDELDQAVAAALR